jgi:pimeloyl-ACP methyl ester carboxylesterase
MDAGMHRSSSRGVSAPFARVYSAPMRVVANGIEIAFEEHGHGDRPLLLVHGFTGFRQDFAGQLPALSQHGRVLAPDLRGHGESARTGDPASYGFEHLTADLLGLLDALGIERCDLLGHSMGGMVALRAALAAPERVASLVLMDTAPGPLSFVDRGQLGLAARVAREAGMAALAQILRARAREDATRSPADRRIEREWGEERFWEWRTARVAAMDPAAYEAFAVALVEQEDLTPRLAEISCPTAVLVGELDHDFLAPSETLARRIPGAELRVLPHAGHQPQHEAPEEWRTAVLEHLARARRR